MTANTVHDLSGSAVILTFNSDTPVDARAVIGIGDTIGNEPFTYTKTGQTWDAATVTGSSHNATAEVTEEMYVGDDAYYAKVMLTPTTRTTKYWIGDVYGINLIEETIVP